jgi:serine/alanine adding enzyme
MDEISIRPADEHRAAWDGLVAAAGGTLYHRNATLDAVAATFRHRVYRLGAWRGADLVGVLPLVRLTSLVFGDYLVSVPLFNYGGPVATDEAAAARLLERAAGLVDELGVSHAEIRCAASVHAGWEQRTDKVAMRLRLAASADAQFAGFSAKLRAQIRRPGKDGFSVRSGGAELLDAFYRVFAINMRDLGTPVYPKRFFANMLAAWKDVSRIVCVEREGRTVAAGLLVRDRDSVEIPWASSLREFNRFGVNMLLYWESIQFAIATGAAWFDFGRSSRGSGTFRFKAQWGAEPLQLNWHYRSRVGGGLPNLTPNNPKYRLALALWRRLPVAVSNRLGPWLARGLP